MDIMNGDYARTHFPCKMWDAGENSLTLSEFEWDAKRKTLIYGQKDYLYNRQLTRPEITEGNPIRLYSLNEIEDILSAVGMKVYDTYSDFNGAMSSDNRIQLMVCSKKE